MRDLSHNRNITDVYGIRLAATSEILDAGSSDNLWRNIFANYVGGVGGEKTQRIHELLFSEEQTIEVEIARIELDEYRDKEVALKDKYWKKHGRLPKQNKL